MSSDTQVCALSGHLLLRTGVVPSSWSGSLPQADGLLEVAESVATALDVEHVAMVQEPVEDGGGEDRIASEQLRPVLDALVGGDEDGASAVAVAHEPEEQARFGPGHGLEAHFVDDQQGDVEVLAPPEPGGRQLGIGTKRGEQLLEAVEGDREAVLDRLDAEGNRQMCLPDPWRALDEQRLPAPDPGAGGKGLDLGG